MILLLRVQLEFLSRYIINQAEANTYSDSFSEISDILVLRYLYPKLAHPVFCDIAPQSNRYQANPQRSLLPPNKNSIVIKPLCVLRQQLKVEIQYQAREHESYFCECKTACWVSEQSKHDGGRGARTSSRYMSDVLDRMVVKRRNLG